MKTNQKIIIGAVSALSAAVTGQVVATSVRAKKQGRTLRSLAFENAAKRSAKLPRKDKSLETCMEESAQPFVLPDFAGKLGLTELDEFEDTFVLEPKDKTTEDIIFYIHGSNYWFKPSKLHYAFIKKAADKLGAELILPVYPKAPAHTAQEIQQMVIDRYLYLINEKGISADKIIFMGDAAGGGMALSILQKLRYAADPLPKMAVLISPWLDATLSNPELADYEKLDPVLNAAKLRERAEAYAGDLELTHPSVSPIYGDLQGLPRIVVFSGAREILCPDVKLLQALADENGLDIDVNIFEGQNHFFLALPIREAEEAFAVIAAELYGVEEVDELPEVTNAPAAEEPAEEAEEYAEKAVAEDIPEISYNSEEPEEEEPNGD